MKRDREETRTLDEGEVHDILRNDRRRAVMDFLFDNNRNATIRELSEHIAALESGEEPAPRNIRQSVYVSLHQTHLPKLEGLGVVDYDTDSKDVELREQAALVGTYMGQEQDDHDPFAPVYVLFGLLGVLLTLLAFGTGSVAGVDIEFWVLPLFVAVAIFGGYQAWSR